IQQRIHEACFSVTSKMLFIDKQNFVKTFNKCLNISVQ
ncbi:hypothetical protein EAI_16399, partial [Harpegnathos saltator]